MGFPVSLSLASSSALLSGQVTLTTAGTFYDGPSLSLAAGTWLIDYKALFNLTQTLHCEFMVRIWDGSTIFDEAENDTGSAPGVTPYGKLVCGSAIVTLAATTTVKLSATTNLNGITMERDLVGGSPGNSHKATSLVAVKVA